MNILVIPTIRELNIKDFLDKWNNVGGWDEVFIVEDNPTKTFNIDKKNITHFSWEDIEKDFGKNASIFSKRDSAIRSYGFFKAYEKGCDWIFTLDDDCLPTPLFSEEKNFCQQHIDACNSHSKWVESVKGIKTRGVPYFNLGKLEVKINMGLWENVADYDAIQQLSFRTKNIPYFKLDVKQNYIIPNGQYFPFCGMNFCFSSEMVSLSYFPPMGLNSQFSRFDDIWFGVICKKICDHLKIPISCGNPIINHSRASNVFTNLKKEAPGIEFNELFWQKIDSIDLKEYSISGCIEEISISLLKEEDQYLKKLGNNLHIWNSLYEK